MTQLKTISENFDHFKFCTIPTEAGKTQVDAMRVSFFSGFACFLSQLMETDNEADLLELMQGVEREVIEFYDNQKTTD